MVFQKSLLLRGQCYIVLVLLEIQRSIIALDHHTAAAMYKLVNF